MVFSHRLPTTTSKSFFRQRENNLQSCAALLRAPGILKAATFTLDFALHQDGPAVQWARDATVGDLHKIAGPRGSSVAPDDFDWCLLIGDATALSSIGRRLESLPLERSMSVIAFIADSEEERYLEPLGNGQVTWLHATGSAERDMELFGATFVNRRVAPGEGFIWVAAETSTARSIYRT